jgi:thiamine pyrophosphate-dependent acetolactate synthase large subunit-like protein
MPTRKRLLSEKVESVNTALDQINVAEAARQSEMAESTLRYDLEKVRQALPEILENRHPTALRPPPQPSLTDFPRDLWSREFRKTQPVPKRDHAK